MGRWLARPGVARARLGDGGRVWGGKRRGQLSRPSWLVGCGGRFLHTAPWAHSLSVSNYDKWRRVKVAGWQLPPLREEQVFLALRLGALALG